VRSGCVDVGGWAALTRISMLFGWYASSLFAGFGCTCLLLKGEDHRWESELEKEVGF
jgi:hypothetical protein